LKLHLSGIRIKDEVIEKTKVGNRQISVRKEISEFDVNKSKSYGSRKCSGLEL
jgi:hypothetical protein